MKKVITFIILIFSIIILSSCGKKTDSYDYNTNYNQKVDSDTTYHDDVEDIDYNYYNARVQYASNKKKALVPVVYSDEIFFKDSNQYHHFLAKQSIGLALASFNIDADYDVDEDTSDGTVCDYLYQTGFDYLRVDDYYKETSEYTVGSVIGKKTIRHNGEEAILFVVAIRGGNYKNEWQSNLNVNSGVRHEGFDNAATLITDRLLSYITRQEDIGDFKVWVTGFSRAGAIANLVAANLNSSLLFNKDSVYAYTFAAPEVVWGDIENENYTNIYNIMNASDFIPQFVPMQWDYKHYGTNLYLPGSEFDSKFDSKYGKIQEALKLKNVTTNYNTNFNLRVRLFYGLFLELCPDEFVFSAEVQPLFLSILGDKSINNVIHLIRNTFIDWKNSNPELITNKNQIMNYILDFLPHLMLKDGFMSGYDNDLYNPLLQLAHEHFH